MRRVFSGCSDSVSHSVGPRNEFPFAAQWLAYALPCRRFARVVADDATQGSGPMLIATPSSQWTCTTYSLPVSRRTRNEANSRMGMERGPSRMAGPGCLGRFVFATNLASSWTSARRGRALWRVSPLEGM